LFNFETKAAKDLDKNLRELGARGIIPVQLGNENNVESDFGSLVADFNMWKRRMLKLFLSNDPNLFVLNGKNPPVSRDPSGGEEELVESSTDEEDFNMDEDTDIKQAAIKIYRRLSSSGVNGGSSKESETSSTSSQQKSTNSSGVVDLEDIGSVVQKARKRIQEEKEERKNGVLKEMITPELRQALTKQGYKLIGSHSGVKLCRWTKVYSQP